MVLSRKRKKRGTLTLVSENSSSSETYNNGVRFTTSPEEMTSVRTCYCKHEGNAARGKNNDIATYNGNRHATVASKKSIVINRICRSGRESCKRARPTSVTNVGTLNTNRSIETEPPNSVLSPETSTALENAEKIINNARMQLMEVCTTSSFESTQRNRNTYSDEPPWDDETEERLYIRELVASKFHDVCSSRLSEVNGKTSSHSEKHDSPRVTVRRVDLSAPKFRVSRRRRADWSSLGYESDDRLRERASPVRVPSRNSIGIANEMTVRDDRDRRRTSARENTCEIQIGPSVHIVDRELTRQDLEDVHISPELSRVQSRANTATYTLHHDVIRNVNDPEGAPRTRRVRLDTLQSIGNPVEAAIEATSTNLASKSQKDLEKVGNPDSGQVDGQVESSNFRIYRQERKDQKPDPQDVEDTGISECLKNAVNQRIDKTLSTDRNEKLKNEARNENHVRITFGGDEISYADDGGIFCKRNDTDHLRNDENIVDKNQAEESQGDRSKFAGDTSRKTGFPRCENIALREAESSIPYRTIDEYFSHTFNSHNGQDGLCNVVSEDVRRRSFVSDCTDVSQVDDNLDKIDLYRPYLDDLDTILHSNDRKIERVVRTTRNLSELLSGPEFAMYKLDEDECMPQDANNEKLCRDSSIDKDNKCSFALNEPVRSSILETELKNKDLMGSEIHRTEDLKGINATEMKSSAFVRENVSRNNYSKNSIESSVFPASDASDDPRTSRDSDKTQRSAAKARLSESSINRSDVTTFSGLIPALSSTRTEPQTYRLREEEIGRSDHQADVRSHGVRRSGKEYTDDGIFARLSQKDTFQATDRFIAYILQDEKQSIEGKVASALKESTVTPGAVQKLLDHLRKAESIRDARQTETLDILRNILINVKGQTDQGNMNDKEMPSRNISDSSIRMKALPVNVINELTSREKEARQMPAEIDASETGWVAKNSHELRSTDDHSFDFEYRKTKESVHSTARCKLTQSENNSKDTSQTEKNADIARTVSIDAKNQTDKSVNENDLEKKEMLPQIIIGSSIRMNATSDATEETILRTRGRNNTSGTRQITDKSRDSRSPDGYSSVSPPFPEMKRSVRSAVHLEFAGSSKNNSKNNSKRNSEAESLKQISDIRSDADDNLEVNSEHISTKIARSGEEGQLEVVNLITTIAVSENKEDNINNERLEEHKTNDAVNKDQYANKTITQTDQVIGTQSEISEAAKEIEKTSDIVTLTDKKVLFALSEVSKIKNEFARSDASPIKSKFIDKSPIKTDVNLAYPSAKKDTGSLRETEIDPRHIAISFVNNSREIALHNEQISLDIDVENNSMRNTRNEEIRKLTTLVMVENRRDENEISELQKTTRSDNERRSIDLTEKPRNYRIDVLSSSNSSISSTLLDHDDRLADGMSSAKRFQIGTTPETSHSEGELYMPSSCSYSLGEVRVLRRKHDLIDDNAMDRDSSVTVLVTRSMLTSLNDSTVVSVSKEGGEEAAKILTNK